MSIFDRFKPQGGAPTGTLDGVEMGSFSRGMPVHIDISRMSNAEMYRTQPHLRTVIGFIARNVAHCALHSYGMKPTGERDRDRDSTMARLLRRPNSEMTGQELILATVSDLALNDDAYWWVVPNVDSPIGWDIIWLPYAWVIPKNKDAFRRKEYLVRAPGAEDLAVPAAEVLHFHGFNPEDPRKGLSPVEALKGILQEQLQSSNYRLQVWKRGGRVSSVLKRPIGAPKWSKKAKAQFRDDWYANYTGNGAAAGGTPILDDGMELQKIDFSAKDQEYVEGTKLAFSTVASVYFVNPTMVGILDNANFGNVREFRKMLYGETLGPVFAALEQRITTFLPGMLDGDVPDDGSLFVEFNVKEKMQGDFEVMTKALQSGVGGPWMTVNEARATQNLPPIDGGDEIIVPMNVVRGGGDQASPNDSGTQNEVGDPVQPGASASATLLRRGKLSLVHSIKAAPPDARKEAAATKLRKYFERQERVVRTALGVKADGDWWDEERWDDELTADLLDVAKDVAVEVGSKAAKDLGYDGGFDPEQAQAFLEAVAASNAKNINAATRQAVADALASDDASAAVESVFTVAKEQRSVAAGAAIVTAAAGFATCEAATQVAPEDSRVTKTWRTGSNPRPTHASMDGETVGIDESFSNGAQWPADMTLDAAESAGCNCSVDVDIESAG